MKVLLFGMLAEDISESEIELDTIKDVNSLKIYLVEKYPSLLNRQFFIAINQQKADQNVVLKADDEIALIPPFAGG